MWNPHVTFYKVKDVAKPKGFGYQKYHRFEYSEQSPSQYRFRNTELMTVKIPCEFNFKDFPFDTNQCNATFFELRFYEAYIDVKGLKFDVQRIYNETESILMNIPKSPFEIQVTIGEHYKWKNSGVISFTLKRVSLGLLLGSFYIPTGIFAALSVGSYVINPDIVSIKLGFFINEKYSNKLSMKALQA